MSKVEGWFLPWAVRFVEASCRSDYPVPGSEHGEPYWKVIQDAFSRHGVTEAAADQAISKVLEANLFPDAARPKVIDEAKAAQAGMSNQPRAQAGTREAAKLDTPEGCECSQTGLVVRFRHVAVGNGEKSNAAGYRVTCYCVCPMGRWIKAQHDVDTRRLFLDLAEHPGLQLRPVAWSDRPDNPHRYHPDHWNPVDNRPAYHEPLYAKHRDYRDKHGVAALRELFKRESVQLAKAKSPPPKPVPPTDADYARAEARRKAMGLPPEQPRRPATADSPSGRADASSGRIDDQDARPNSPRDLDNVQESSIDRPESLDYNPGRSDEETRGPGMDEYDYL